MSNMFLFHNGMLPYASYDVDMTTCNIKLLPQDFVIVSLWSFLWQQQVFWLLHVHYVCTCACVCRLSRKLYCKFHNGNMTLGKPFALMDFSLKHMSRNSMMIS